jgi:acetyltransferase
MLDMFFAPKNIAVIGASQDPTKIGHIALKNIIEGGFNGAIYPVNLKEKEILGRTCYPTVKDIPGNVDIGVVVVPSKVAVSVVQECADKGVRGLIIITAGFREIGEEGMKLEREMGRIAKAAGMRIIGPNCLGMMDTATNLNASFVGSMPIKGNIAFLSQSGALCSAVLDWSYENNIGFSKFISIGNKLDVAEPDLLQALEEDEQTEVVMAYLEDIQTGRRFMQAAASLTRKKPLLVLKSGRTTIGAKAISSHTGSLAGDDKAYTIALKQAGALRCKTIRNLFDLANGFSKQPLLEGDRIAFVTNAGGPGVMASDATEDRDLQLATFDPETLKALTDYLPPAAAKSNPVDVLGDALPDRYGFAFDQVINDDHVDGVMVILTPQAMTKIEETAEVIGQKSTTTNKPVFACFIGGREVEKAAPILAKYNVPMFPYPENGVYTFQKMHTYAGERQAPLKDWLAGNGNRKPQAEKFIKTALAEGRTTLNEWEARSILAEYGIPISAGVLTHDADEAVTEANTIGYPVALKIVSPDILHKSDIGAIKLKLTTADEVESAYEEIMRACKQHAPEARLDGILVDPMVQDETRQVILGMKNNPQFGPMMMFGLGGIFVEVLKDVSFRIAPLTIEEAHAMMEETKSYPLLIGARGDKKFDVDVIADALVKLSHFALSFPEVQELDINPIMVKEEGHGAVAVDVKMVVSA